MRLLGLHALRWAIGAAVGALVVAICWNVSFRDEDWNRLAVGATIAVAIAVGEALPDVRRLLPEPGFVTGLIVVSCAAVYGCVPETDHLPGIGMTLAGVALIERAQRRIVPLAWHVVALALVLWAGLYGATGQQRALVGTLFAFWTMIMPVIIVRLRPSVAHNAAWVRLTIVGLASAAALVVARTGALEPGRRPAVSAAALLSSISLAVAVIVALVARPRQSTDATTPATLPRRMR